MYLFYIQDGVQLKDYKSNLQNYGTINLIYFSKQWSQYLQNEGDYGGDGNKWIY